MSSVKTRDIVLIMINLNIVLITARRTIIPSAIVTVTGAITARVVTIVQIQEKDTIQTTEEDPQNINRQTHTWRFIIYTILDAQHLLIIKLSHRYFSFPNCDT